MLDEILKITELLCKDIPKEVECNATPNIDGHRIESYCVEFLCSKCFNTVYVDKFPTWPCDNEAPEHVRYCSKCGQKIKWPDNWVML